MRTQAGARGDDFLIKKGRLLGWEGALMYYWTIILLVRNMVQYEQILSSSESGLRFLTDNDFPLWLTWEMVQIADVS